jgi:HJR/Mrr/RecB family endonuclease
MVDGRTRSQEPEDVKINDVPPIGYLIVGAILISGSLRTGITGNNTSLVISGVGALLIVGYCLKAYLVYQNKGIGKVIDYSITAPVDRKEDYSTDLSDLNSDTEGIEETQKGVTLDHLRNIDYNEFEELVAKVWRKKGYDTEIVPDGGGDGGIDVIATRENMGNTEKVLIQVKRNSEDNKVSSPKVREYSGLKNQEDNVDKVYVVTTSSFTSNAKDVAKQNNVKTLNGKEFLNQYQKLVEQEGEN